MSHRRHSIFTKNQLNKPGDEEDDDMMSLPTPTPTKNGSSSLEPLGSNGRMRFGQSALQQAKQRREASFDPGQSPSIIVGGGPSPSTLFQGL